MVLTSMRYSEVRPNDYLAPFIECFWMLEGAPGALTEAAPERILPDGCAEIILNFAAPFRAIDQNGLSKIQPSQFLVGQMTRPIFIVPTGEARLIGIRFHPGGTFPFIDIPLGEAIDSVIELGAISSGLARELLTATDRESALRDQIAALQAVLVNRLGKSKKESRLLGLAASIVQSAGLVSVDELASQAAMSSRQLRRRFLQEVGIGPKLLCRLLRFQRVFAAVDREDHEWAGVAFECGYYDQAHLIKDFRQFANQTPAALRDNSSNLTEAFLRKNRASVFSNTYSSRIS
jgi:AraC-like DNA-binding protein